MTRPVYKIETYTGAVLDHTIENEALTIRTTEVLTDNVGSFSFAVPTKKNGSDYYFDDVSVFDKVKIWFGYDTVSGDPDFIGRILRISAPLSMETGYIRVFKGRSQGEILQRRFKQNKHWDGIGASTIVTELANDLSLGTGDIEADATSVDLTVKTDTYFSLLQKISDYYDGGGSIQKDFYVDVDYDLVWASRDGTAPFRSGASVETLTVGDNIINYSVLRDIERVRNNIQVYGAANTYIPTDKDDWTENDSTNWTATQGSLQHDYSNGWAKVGTYCIKSTAPASKICQFHRTHDRVTMRTVNSLNFWHFDEGQTSVDNWVRLRAPDSGNYFQALINKGTSWMLETLSLGPNNETADAAEQGKWYSSGSPNWWNIQAVEFWYERNALNQTARTDGVYYAPDRVYGSAEDNTSKTNYGEREAEFIDDTLLAASDCSVRAETLLYQLKDPAVRIDVTTPGNTNILVGDRLSMTIPAEGISAANYDVVSVAHSFSPRGFFTTAAMVDSANVRGLPATSLNEVFRALKSTQGAIGKGVELVK